MILALRNAASHTPGWSRWLLAAVLLSVATAVVSPSQVAHAQDDTRQKPPESLNDGDKLQLNYFNVELAEVVKFFMDLRGENYITAESQALKEPERLALLDRSSLTVVPQQDEPRARLPADLEQTLRLPVSQLPRLVDQQDVGIGDPTPAACEQAGDSSRLHARAITEIGGGRGCRRQSKKAGSRFGGFGKRSHQGRFACTGDAVEPRHSVARRGQHNQCLLLRRIEPGVLEPSQQAIR